MSAREEQWFSAKALAGLPGMPGTQQNVTAKAKRDGWACRKRSGKGGGREYAFSSLPIATQAALLKAAEPAARAARAAQGEPAGAPGEYDAEALWAWAATRPASLQKEGERRAALLDQVMVLVNGGQPFRAAAKAVAEQHADATPGTLKNWYYGVNGQPGARHFARHDWPAALIPRYAGRTEKAPCSPEAWDVFKADYLRLEQPSANSCYRRLTQLAEVNGWTIPSVKALLRRLREEVGEVAVCLAREGAEAAMRRYPAQQRDRSVFHALEAVNADGHKFDVFVRFPGMGPKEKGRAMLTVWQDLYSGKILAWRVSQTESSDSYRLSFADLLRDYGIPRHIYVDNGRGIASKMLTGGSATRYRGKVTAEDPLGLFTQLVGSDGIHWTTPYHGQAKPIERAFRDMCDDIAKHPEFAGAYTGNTPMNKPENYGKRAIELEAFLAVVERGIREHNARPGRRAAICAGRSFDAVFQESYQANAHRIPRPTRGQLRKWLLTLERATADKTTGAIHVLGNRYWSEPLARLAGLPANRRRVMVAFDPDNLHAGVQVETLDGREICFAPCLHATGFNDTQAARDHARNKAAYKRATKEQLEAQRRMDTARLGQLLEEADDGTEPPTPSEQKVTHGVFQPVRKVVGSDIREDEQEEVSPEERYRFDETVEMLARMRRRERL
ncbi:transposase A [Thioalkalivibrio sulfidiphilus HL-EbGr7]|uniref:Transposase A n=1 Tax=Thioalkalivibrio sulfidiphilus (strain HL-EbGR7) TaxID=396588 RepID=B8GS44_THISH|nr:transposase domain-containing protein [Thioalkalivibrio sulfidiphilus]ACL72748.1 transposase A [Thioalkalivibrio sulfidiphilus HL-EbGr7]